MAKKWESAPSKSWQDNKKWSRSHIIALFFVFLILGAGITLAVFFIYQNSSLPVAILYGVLGGLIGLMILFVLSYLVHLVKASKQQRDEARKLLDLKEEELRTNQNTINTLTQNTADNQVAISQLKNKYEALYKLYEPIRELESIKEGDVIRYKEINVSLMFQKLNVFVLTNVTFDHCIFKGPCMIVLLDNVNFQGNDFGKAKLEDILILADNNRRYVGVCGFAHCAIMYCAFENVGILADDKTMKQFKQETITI